MMDADSTNAQPIELKQEIPNSGEVRYDPDSMMLIGSYSDEISLFRAKKVWTEVLEANFLLESKQDFALATQCQAKSKDFVLRCTFTSACGRYAFWRLIHDQAPETQYRIEIAHIPEAFSRREEILSAPDLAPLRQGSLFTPLNNNRNNKLLCAIQTLLKRLL